MSLSELVSNETLKILRDMDEAYLCYSIYNLINLSGHSEVLSRYWAGK